MTSIQLPPLTFDDGGLRLSLFSPPGLKTQRASTADTPTTTAPVISELESQPLPEATHPTEIQLAELEESPAPRISDHYERDMPEPLEPPLPPQPSGIPTHPIPEMQDAFAESLEEVTLGGTGNKPNLRSADAKDRRERLLAQGKDDEPFDARWRYRPGQQQHEVFKLIAQISFGVYLLLNGMANDNGQVVSILQGHINEVDEFLEVALEDLNESLRDLNERVECLQLPMANANVFEGLLEDRNYRAEVLDGNEKIDHILGRTNAVMKQWDDDIDAGLQCTTAFQEWLNTKKNAKWRKQRSDLVDIFDAMKGNAEGWISAFDDMNAKTQEMNTIIIRLMTIMAEVEKKAGESTIPPFSSPAPSSPISRKETSSISTPRSLSRSAKAPSVGSGSFPNAQHKGFDEDLQDMALPGALPLLPPPRSFARPRKPSFDSQKLKVDTQAKPRSAKETSEVKHSGTEQDDEDEPLYLLQPRTYTPQPPEPLPSPMVRDSASSRGSGSLPQSHQSEYVSTQNGQDRSSIRHRVSLKGAPPRDIQIPPRPIQERPSSNSPRFASPRTSERQSSIDSEIENFRHHHLPRMSSHAELGRSPRPPLMPSPNSDHQYYRPVKASPHSPLQQRPHTAAGPDQGARRQPSGTFSHHTRNQPSRLGGMSTLSTVTSASRTIRPNTPGASTVATGKSLKKKKSAFGWLKKAFTMDDAERAQFEARKQMQYEEVYYKDKSPKFLDGKRIR